MREVIADDPPYENGKCRRVDSLGYFVFKFSDDHGRTWSEKRWSIPVREMAMNIRLRNKKCVVKSRSKLGTGKGEKPLKRLRAGVPSRFK
ncbi:MAG: hypothetical protein J7M27_12735 [Candidatus Latescibacteria bacterium]|nr:hypothetical protein [Candidatus Latescibacterota bacterium]